MAVNIPSFTRRPFAINQSDREPKSRSEQLSLFPIEFPDENRYYDVIVRLPLADSDPEVPVGIVSKNYTLVQHHEVLATTVGALASVGFGLSELECELILTEYGSRMALKLRLPQRLDFDPGDGNRMALQMECFNSVDRRIPLRVELTWFRLVCSNGLMVRTNRTYVDRAHNFFLDLKDIREVLTEGLQQVAEDKATCLTWLNISIHCDTLIEWVDGPLRAKWGVLAAARTYHIAKTGFDGVPCNRFEKSLPHEKEMKATIKVPGSAPPASNAFAISQILAWLAKERRDVQEQVGRREDVPKLMDDLLKLAKSKSGSTRQAGGV